MSILQTVEAYIGQKMTFATRILWRADDDELTHGVAFQFGSRFLILKAESNSDTISLHESAYVEEWLQRQPESNTLSLERCRVVQAFEGQVLTNVWECQSEDNYTDAIDFAFGDLNYPTLKVFCITSELHLLSIAPLHIGGSSLGE